MSGSLDVQNVDWRDEAVSVIHDVGFALKSITISKQLSQSPSEVFLNIETKERKQLCVQFSNCGFKVVSDRFDSINDTYDDQTYYETSYALLDKYSKQFRQCFASSLERKLRDLSTT